MTHDTLLLLGVFGLGLCHLASAAVLVTAARRLTEDLRGDLHDQQRARQEMVDAFTTATREQREAAVVTLGGMREAIEAIGARVSELAAKLEARG